MPVSLLRWYVFLYHSICDANKQMWLGNKDKVYILDKTENNPVTINGQFGTHPAWAVEYDIKSNTCMSMKDRLRTMLTIRPTYGCLVQHFLCLWCSAR
jgi:hypothetical protein